MHSNCLSESSADREYVLVASANVISNAQMPSNSDKNEFVFVPSASSATAQNPEARPKEEIRANSVDLSESDLNAFLPDEEIRANFDEHLSESNLNAVFNSFVTNGSYEGSLLPAQFDQIVDQLSTKYGFSIPVSIDHVQGPNGPVPANYLIRATLQEWTRARQESGHVDGHFPDFVAFRGMVLHDDNLSEGGQQIPNAINISDN
ncbi:hypothetical protein PtA15_7A241 [Puccinia triticina]|uniref:NLE domain-containing protein n=1 Tax=Puccinia triticina TaxID=208348 RepID=A0ABY7CN78_9BASI|nr:uncharacterized protein PtA15_7A241 [Puccinia triticina]WAQ86515.1 hypothetical protein PtA15_7A241 [Puccinia triticina]